MAEDTTRPGDDEAVQGEPEDFRSERRLGGSGRPKVGTALIETSSGRQVAVQYVDVGGMAMFEGDIALGPVEAVDSRTGAMRDDASRGIAFAVAITGAQYRWTNCTMPYEIDPNLPNQGRVTDAIQHWRDKTGMKFVVRTTEANWVYFTDDGGCWSYVGMRGGRQTISVGPGCSTGNTIHEIGHAMGLWHEQSREDRDTFVTINWVNIQAGMESQFSQHISDGDDVGGYDYGSIMHYPRTAFSKNGQETITPVDPSAQIGQRVGLSAGDIAAIAALYPLCHLVVQPKRPWTDPPKFKKILDDRRIKKIIDDERWIKPVRDPITGPGGGIGPVKFDARPEIGPVVNPVTQPGGVLQPFSLITPHHADVTSLEEQAVAESATLAATLQRQLLEAEAAVARARAAAAEAALELNRLEAAKSDLEAAYIEVLGSLPDLGSAQG